MMSNKELMEWMLEQKKKPNRYKLGGIGRYENGVRLFDCIGLFKCKMWNDYSEKNASHYKENVPDWNETQFFNNAKVKGKMETLPEELGVALWMNGHIGFYLGNKQVIECTIKKFPSGEGNGIVISQFYDKKAKNFRGNWTNWFYLPMIDYNHKKPVEEEKKKLDEIVKEVIKGRYGIGAHRKQQLEKLGYNYIEVQNRVNQYYEAARDVWKGYYGNGKERVKRLEDDGFDYATVQMVVNREGE